MTIRLPTHRPPTHPGEMMLEEFLKPRNISRKAFAQALELPYGRVNKILNRQGRVTAGIAYRLSKYTGISPEFWLEGQMAWDMWHALRSEAAALDRIQPLERDDQPSPEDLAALLADEENGEVMSEAREREEVAAG